MKKYILISLFALVASNLHANCSGLAENIDKLQKLIPDFQKSEGEENDDDLVARDYTQEWTAFTYTLAGETINFSFPTLSRKINYVLQKGFSIGTSITHDDGAKYQLTYILQGYAFDKWDNPPTIFSHFISNLELSKYNEIQSSNISTVGGFQVLDVLVYDKQENDYSRYHYILTNKCGYLFVVHYVPEYIEQMDEVISSIQITN